MPLDSRPAPVTYPPARRSETFDVLHGERVADPYRWLEDPDAAETRAFVAAQNELSAPILAALPGRAAFSDLLTRILHAPSVGLPHERLGRTFAWVNDGTTNQDVLVVSDDGAEPSLESRVLLDPNALDATGTTAVTSWSVSPDGQLLAYAAAEAGSDWRTIRVLDVATGAVRPDELAWTKWVEPTWLPDSSGFLYWVHDAPAGATFADVTEAGYLRLHRLGDAPADDVTVWHRPDTPKLFAYPDVAGDWLVIRYAAGSSGPSDLAVRRLVPGPRGTDIDPDEIALTSDARARWSVLGAREGRLVLHTDDGAPRRRIVTVEPDGVGADSEPDFRELVGESADALLPESVLTADGLALVYSRDATHRVVLAPFEPAGDAVASVTLAAQRRAVDLGESVTVAAIDAEEGSAVVHVRTVSFTDAGTNHRVVTSPSPKHRVLARPGGAFDVGEVSVTRPRATSADGTEVPMFLVRRADSADSADSADAAGGAPQPTLLYGYGGFRIEVNPEFRAIFVAWVAAGGTLAVATLRGGGEYGEDWHEAGTKDRKQNVFDDLYACAEWLRSSGTASQIAVHGRSNGGLLVGAAMTQRPELWAAALPTVGVLDMLRFHLFTVGWAWRSDYGDPDDPADFPALHAYSPLHRVRSDVAYPPTLICTGDHDDRVVPAHSLKFGAELQHAGSGGSGPVLLRIDTRAGHGMGKPKDAQVAEFADQLAFAAQHTGLEVEAPPTP
ncbi:S9 family peptidase [Occultella glacieicola]|uniref:prolyl oligopeptidase n=1 Tax=Occultella glacieicola TaxID=2518684 RepID=A0ABY2E706_9MICO|nr:prolyl oligopeptidase family serine peptidase [Occultella glacieicola]TDE95848.1 S9 family peptidase [Occultella glacieicola]